MDKKYLTTIYLSLLMVVREHREEIIMSAFEILCTTMHQTDFSKVKEMNIHSDVVFANQADRTEFTTQEFNGHRAKMITTATRGVGKNRNIALLYAEGDICLLADDDVVYTDDMEEKVLKEFKKFPNADVIIFHVESTDPSRPQPNYKKPRKIHRWNRMPWPTFRIAFRLSSVKTGNVWFTTLFGGGCVFPSGEDSMWLNTARRKGLRIYVSTQTIGKVSYEVSSWFTGYDERYFYGKGAYHQAVHPHSCWIWKQYARIRFRNFGALSQKEKMKWFTHGTKGYKKLLSYQEYVKTLK